MDWIDTLKESFNQASAALGIAKQVKDLLPDSLKKQKLADELEQAERRLKLMESQAAQALGFQLCKNHDFPGVIMRSADERNWICPECGNEKHPSPPIRQPRYGSQRGSIEDKTF